MGTGVADLERAVPGGEHREVVLVELGDRLRVVDLELGVGDLVDPGAHRLAEELATGLAADRVGDGADGIGWIDEAEGHGTDPESRGGGRRQNVARRAAVCGGVGGAAGPAGRAADPS